MLLGLALVELAVGATLTETDHFLGSAVVEIREKRFPTSSQLIGLVTALRAYKGHSSILVG